LGQIFNPRYATLVATRVLNRFNPAELTHSCIARLVCGHARFNVLPRPHLNVPTHLFSHLRV